MRGLLAYGDGVVVTACQRSGAPVLTGREQESLRGCGNRDHRRSRRLDTVSTVPGRCVTPIPGNGSLTPKSPKFLAQHSLPHTHAVTARLIVRRVEDAATPMRCSRSGGITPSSPTLRKRPPTPMSPTVATPSSRPCSPTSSTARWRICPQDASAPTPPGSCAPRSPTTCCARSACWPVVTHAVARGAALRRRIVTIPARLARPQRRPVLHSTAPLALVPSLACPVAQHDRIQPTGDRSHLDQPPQGPTRGRSRKS